MQQLALAALGLATFTGGAFAQTGFQNLGRAIFAGQQVTDSAVAYYLNEAHQGVDANGDGDALDGVLQVHDFASGTTTNTGIAGGQDPLLGDDIVFFGAPEFAEGNSDLNGDGDVSDEVLHMYEPSTGTTRNFKLALAGVPNLDGDLLTFLVSESNQSADLNGDGDSSDLVVFTYDHASATLKNRAVASSSAPLPAGSCVAFARSEVDEATDFNGDGDQFDSVLHIIDVGSGTLTNLGIHVAALQLNAAAASAWVFEIAQGGDLNGDGDVGDSVLHVVDLSTMTVTNTGLAVANSSKLDGRRIAFDVTEGGQGGADLNGDGDTFDNVMHIHDIGLGTTTNIGVAGAAMSFSGPRLVFGAPELSQGNTDLNGDGDTTDQVLHTYNALSGQLTNSMLATRFIEIEGRNLGMVVFEGDQGGVDLNGDGDASDNVLHIQRAGFPVANLGLACGSSFRLEGDTLLFNVPEADEAGLDRNADGDALDFVLAGYRFARPTLRNFRLATDQVLFRLSQNSAAVGVIEASQGASDLNGDGDANDAVIWVAGNLF